MVYFRENMNVWDIRFGYGNVEGVSDDDVFVNFAGRTIRYTTDGRFLSSENVSLLQVEPLIQRNVPIVSFEKGELVLVFAHNQWVMRYYSHFDDDNHYCFDVQKTRGTTTTHIKVIKYADNPLLKKES